MGPGIAANVPYPDLASLDFGACSITTPSAGCRTASTRGGSPTASRSDWSTTTSTRTTPNLSPRETCSSSRPSTPRAGRTARTKAETQVSFAWWTTERWRFRTTTATGCTSRWATPSPPARWECCSSISRNGVATVDEDDELMAVYTYAQFIVRVAVREVFPNCPRYIHRYQLVERSKFVPRKTGRPPVPDWKRSDWACDVLPEGDPAREPATAD